MQNFEANEDFHFSYLTREGQVADTLALTAKDFAALCRALDLGQGYQQHLQQVFDRPGNAQQLREQMSEATRADVQLLVLRARIKKPLKEYSSTSAFAKDLAISLQTTEYSRALAAKVPQALKGQFIRRLESTLFEDLIDAVLI